MNACAMFETERFMVIPLFPSEIHGLLNQLLQNEELLSSMASMEDKSLEDVLSHAANIEKKSASGMATVWGIVERNHCEQIGAIIAENSLEGINVQVLVATKGHYDEEVADEAVDPVVEWLVNNANAENNFPKVLH